MNSQEVYLNRGETMKPFKHHLQLFKETLLISAFTFGGGYVIVPLLKKRFVDELHWIKEEEIIDLVAIAQSSPGPLAVNASIMIGYKLSGLKGALVATLGTSLPPLIIITLISKFYDFFQANTFISTMMIGMQAAVAAIILNVCLTMFQQVIKNNRIRNTVIFSIAFIASYLFKVNVMLVILASAFIGLGIMYYERGTKHDLS